MSPTADRFELSRLKTTPKMAVAKFLLVSVIAESPDIHDESNACKNKALTNVSRIYSDLNIPNANRKIISNKSRVTLAIGAQFASGVRIAKCSHQKIYNCARFGGQQL